MNRINALFVLFFLTVSCLIVPLPVKAGSRTIVVPDDYASVQSAINNASRGDTVFVRSGTYNETLLISKSIRLIGENANTTTLTIPAPYVMFAPSTTVVGITADNFEISNFTIRNDNVDGVGLMAIGDGIKIMGNIVKAYVGLKVTGSNVTIVQNSVSAYQGLSVYGNFSIIAENAIPDSYIALLGDSNTVTGNTAQSIGIGRDFFAKQVGRASSSNIVFRNTIGSMTVGEGAYNLFTENTLETMTIGTYGALAENDTFYHNNFLGNSEHVQNYNLNNTGHTWDNGKEGNYWNDYYGTDADGDGIGDSPYAIDANNHDNYPLMYPWGTPSVDTEVAENSWKIKTPMQQARSGLGVASVKGKIYAIGGATKGGTGYTYSAIAQVALSSITISGYVGTNEEYDPVTNKWINKASMPTPRTLFATAVYQNKIYCIGGRSAVSSATGTSVGANEVYDPASDTWETKASMPTARDWLAGNVVNGKIYLIDETSNEVYDPATDSWTNRTSMPRVPYDGWFHVSAVFDDKIYVIGERLRIYDPETDMWTEGTSPPTGISTGSVAVVTLGIWAPTRIYVLGETNNVYNPSNDSWISGAEVLRKRYSFGATVVDDIICVIGGHTAEKLTSNFAPVAWNDQYMPFGYGTIPPAVHVVSPENRAYSATSVDLVFSIDKPALWMGYSLDGQDNVTAGNTTLVNLPEGSHSVTVYANDTFGNMGASETISFIVAEPFPLVPVAAASSAVAAAAVAGLLLYRKKRHGEVDQP